MQEHLFAPSPLQLTVKKSNTTMGEPSLRATALASMIPINYFSHVNIRTLKAVSAG